MSEQFRPDPIEALRDTVARFQDYCAQREDEGPRPVRPVSDGLDRGDVLMLLPEFPSLATYERLREDYLNAARPVAPRHIAQ